MDRKFIFTKDEILLIESLNKLKIPSGDMPEFQKFFLELKRNIILGGKMSGTLYGVQIIDDEFTNITFTDGLEPELKIEPRPLVSFKPKLSTVVDKIIVQINRKGYISKIYINDMVIDYLSIFNLIKEINGTSVEFVNCYFTTEVVMPVFYCNRVKFIYSSMPSLNILSKLGAEWIEVDKCRFRFDSSKEMIINSKHLSIKNTNFYKKDLFFKLSLPNLEYLKINSGKFHDVDLIFLEKIAPKLKNCEINAQISDLNTLGRINILKYYEHSGGGNMDLKTISTRHIMKHSNMEISLKKNPELRQKIIRLLNLSIESLYVDKKVVDFLPQRKLLLDIEEEKRISLKNLGDYLRKYIMTFKDKIDAEKICMMLHTPNRFLDFFEKYLEYQDITNNKKIMRFRSNDKRENFKKEIQLKKECYDAIINYYNKMMKYFSRDFQARFINLLDKYREGIIKTDIDEFLKYELIHNTLGFELNYTLENNNIRQAIFDLFSPLYKDYSGINEVAKAYGTDLDMLANSHYYAYTAECVADNLRNLLSEFSNKRRTNFDLLDVLSIALDDQVSNYLLRDKEKETFCFNVIPSNHIINSAKKMMAKNDSVAHILSELGYDHFDNKKEYFIPSELDDGSLYVMLAPKKEEVILSKKILSGDALLSYVSNFETKGGIGKALSRYYNKNSEYFNKYNSPDSNLEDEDYPVYCDIYYNNGKNIKRKIFFVVKSMHEEFSKFSGEDYFKIKEYIKYNYTRDSLTINNMLLEVIRHISGKYPPFIERYLNSFFKEDSLLFNSRTDIDSIAISYIDKIVAEGNVEEAKIFQKKRV